MIARWKLVDTETDEQWVMPLNPNKMDPPPMGRTISFHPNGSMRTPDNAAAWSFSGVMLTKAQYDDLVAWVRRDSIVAVHDHLGRVFHVVFESLSVQDKRSRNAWRAGYTVRTLMLRRAA